MADKEDSVDWREKCQELEQVIKTLSTHCIKVVEKYEELMSNYKKNQDQHDHLVEILKNRGEQIKDAKGVLEKVAKDYKALREKYEIAVRCQYEAESYASKVNKAYKRQSQMLGDKLGTVSLVDIKIDDDEGESQDQIEETYIKKLQDHIQELENEKVSLSIELKAVRENYNIETEKTGELKKQIEYFKVERHHSKMRMEKQDKSLKLLAETSEAAFHEYQQLQLYYEKEVTDRLAAEKVAKNYSAERDAARRQSAMLLSNVEGDTKLMKAMIEVEELTTQIEKQKSDYDQKIKLLEEDVATLKADIYVTSIEADKAELESENISLQEQLKIAEQSAGDLRQQYDSLLSKYADLEKKYDESSRVNIPPPPPPPPPPVPKLGGILPKFGKKKKRDIQKKCMAGAETNDSYSKAVDEMMKRIRDGNIGLRPVLKSRTGDFVDAPGLPRKMSLPGRSVPEDDTPTAMDELQGILTKMKKARSEDDLSNLDDRAIDENSELGQIFLKIQAKQGDKSDRPRPAPRKLSTISDKPEDEED